LDAKNFRDKSSENFADRERLVSGKFPRTLTSPTDRELPPDPTEMHTHTHTHLGVSTAPSSHLVLAFFSGWPRAGGGGTRQDAARRDLRWDDEPTAEYLQTLVDARGAAPPEAVFTRSPTPKGPLR
jgi:hypothetical protein